MRSLASWLNSEEELPLAFPVHISEPLQRIIRKLLQRNVADRFQNADELLHALTALANLKIAEPIIPLQSPVTSQSVTVVQANSSTLLGKSAYIKPSKLNRALIATALISGLVAMVLMSVYFLMRNNDIEQARVSPLGVLSQEKHDETQQPVENISYLLPSLIPQQQ
ncbi:MAG: hypothetical protein GXP08_06400 [Gammaproteobacteria bacterium]|nr:hypothetical protein [Gammaproteobacteria bacterium]